jgi:3-dehydroquinate synthase class II
MSLEQLRNYVNVDYKERMAIVGVIKVEDREKIIAVARYDLDPQQVWLKWLSW